MGKKEIDEFVHIEGKSILADCLTKKGASARALLKAVFGLGIENIEDRQAEAIEVLNDSYLPDEG